MSWAEENIIDIYDDDEYDCQIELSTIYHVRVIRKSKKALLIELGNREAWIPLSQIDISSEINEFSIVTDIGTLVIPEWLKEDKFL